MRSIWHDGGVSARVTLNYNPWLCPECNKFAADTGKRRKCPRCYASLIRTPVSEVREISWSGGHPDAAVIRAALQSERDSDWIYFFDDESKAKAQKKQKKMPSSHSPVFISYVRDDSTAIDRLARDLRRARIRFWLDSKNLRGGRRWKPAIRDAIQAGSAVIVCFSTNYSSRSKTYMNEELTQIIDEVRLRPADKSWLIPVRLDDCTIPTLSISGHETLHDLQHVDLFPDWDAGVRQIITALRNP